jgi:hypothetical protein
VRTLAWAMVWMLGIDWVVLQYGDLCRRAKEGKLTVLAMMIWFLYIVGGLWAFHHVFTVRT